MNQGVIVVKSGTDGNTNIKHQGFEIMNHPSGVYAYTKKWNDPNDLGVIKFSHGINSFEINNVMILTGLSDNNFPENGVDNWSLMIRLGYERADSYEQARSKIMSLLNRLRVAGWQRYIEVSDPRLIGRDAVLYELSDPGQTYSLDSTYVPTIEEWKQLVTVEPVWEFYADGG